MIKALRTPKAFLLLLFVIVSWLGVWMLLHTLTGELRSAAAVYRNRPFYNIAGMVLGHSHRGVSTYRNTSQASLVSSHRPRSAERVAIETEKDLYFDFLFRENNIAEKVYNGEAVITAGRIKAEIRHDEYGLIAAPFKREIYRPVATPYGQHPLIDAGLGAAARNEFEKGRGRSVPTTQKVRWNINFKALLHDTLFLLTLIAFGISLTGIPRWPLWKRLTPAQRRRLKNACTRCGYNLEGLTTPTCPECGNALPPSPSQGEGRGEGASAASRK